MIKLYGVPGSRAMRSIWMLEELGVPYANVKISFTGDSRSPEYLKINPNGRVPALQDGDTILWESMAINLYLARKFDKGLWPKTVEDEGHAFKWSLWVMTEAEDPVITAMLHRAFLPEAQREAAKGDDAAKRFAVPLAVLEGQLAGRDVLVGKSFSVADVNVAGVLALAGMAQLDLGSAPNVSAWLGRCTSRPAFLKVMAMM